MARDGDKREAEEKYLTSTKTLREISKEMGIPESTIFRWSKEGKWKEKREKTEEKAIRQARGKYVSKRAQQLQKLEEASCRLEDALMKAADQFARALEDAQGNGKMADGFRARNLQSLSAAIEGATRTRMMIAGILTEENRQKLAIEKKKLKLYQEQARSGLSGTGVEISMEEASGDLSE